MYQRELSAALAACESAAALCRAVRSEMPQLGALEKANNTPVTIADFGSQAVVCKALLQAFPGDAIVAEEGSRELRLPEQAAVLKSVVNHVARLAPEATPELVCQWIDSGGQWQYRQRFWTLDPIDGTKGFLRSDQYAVALALVERGVVQLGVLACPNMMPLGQKAEPGMLYWAVRGQGAWSRPLSGGEAAPLAASGTADPRQARFCESFESYSDNHELAAQAAAALGITAPSVRMDSQAKYAAVARGEADIYLRLSNKSQQWIWDHAAGVLLVEEAGGTVTDRAGKRLDFSQVPRLEAAGGIITTNGKLHGQVLAALSGV